MQIKLNLQVFLFIIIFAFTHQIGTYVLIMFFILIHELGHMFTGILLKLKPKSLSFMPFGVSITFEGYGYRKLIEIKKIIISIAGPLTNIIICIIISILHVKNEIKELIIYSNLLIALFNLIPVYPLDGGRILKSLIRLKYDEIKSDEIINKISNIIIIILTVLSSILILYLKNIAILFVITYLWITIIKENKRFKTKKKIYNTLQKDNECIDI